MEVARTPAELPSRAQAAVRDAGLVLGVYVLTRLLVVAVVAAAPGRLTLTDFAPWDGVYYLAIATEGYPRSFPPQDATGSAARSTLAFFPGYPLAVRGLDQLGLDTVTAGLVVSLIFGALAAVAVLGLAQRLLPADRARSAAAMWVCWPGTAALSFVYSEGLFLAAAAGCLLALTTRWWVVAGVLGAVASATRPSGVALVAAASVAAVLAVRSRRDWRALLAPALGGAGVLAWVAFLHLHTGDAAGWLDLQERGWGQRIDFGIGFGSALTSPSNLVTGIWLLYLTGFALLAASAWAVRRGARLPLPHATLVAMVLAQCLLYSNVGPRPRLLAVAVPLFVLVAGGLPRRVLPLVVAGCAVLLTVVTWLHVRGVVAP